MVGAGFDRFVQFLPSSSRICRFGKTQQPGNGTYRCRGAYIRRQLSLVEGVTIDSLAGRILSWRLPLIANNGLIG
jgi:hypothetical protein